MSLGVDIQAEHTTLGWQFRLLGGVRPDTPAFVLKSVDCAVSVEFVGGYLVLSCPILAGTSQPFVAYRSPSRQIVRAKRPMELGLCRESEKYRQSKERGINREVSIGDPEFDRQVRVHTHTSDDIVRAVLADGDLRMAVLELLDDYPVDLMIDDGRGRFRAHFLAGDDVHDPKLAARIADLFVAIYLRLPAIETAGTRPLRWTQRDAIGLVVLVCLPGGVISLLQTVRNCTEAESVAASACWAPPTVGMIGGLMMALPVCVAIFAKMRGKFHSAAWQRVAMIASTIVLTQLATIIAGLYW